MADTETETTSETTEGTETETATSSETTEETTIEPKTLLEDPGTGELIAAPVDWPDDWRDKMAGDNEDERKRLERMKSPADVWKSYTNMEKKFKQGEEPNPFPGEGTDEEKATWRKDAGIPAKAGEYIENYTLEGGLVIGDDEKEIVDGYLEMAHEAHETPDTVKRNLNWYMGMRAKEVEDRQTLDEEDKVKSRDQLRDELGPDFNRMVSAAFGLIEQAPDEVRDLVLGGRLADGTPFGSHAPTLKWLMDIALQANPAASVVPGDGADSMGSIQDELDEIAKFRKENRADYFKDEKKQARERQLIEARDKLKAHKAA